MRAAQGQRNDVTMTSSRNEYGWHSHKQRFSAIQASSYSQCRGAFNPVRGIGTFLMSRNILKAVYYKNDAWVQRETQYTWQTIHTSQTNAFVPICRRQALHTYPVSLWRCADGGTAHPSAGLGRRRAGQFEKMHVRLATFTLRWLTRCRTRGSLNSYHSAVCGCLQWAV